MKCFVILVISLIQLNRISCKSYDYNEISLTPDCASGPSAWCESLGSSTNCKATEHCYQNVWSKDWQHVGKPKNCVMCHKMMDEVKSALQVGDSGPSTVVALIDNDKICTMAQLCAADETNDMVLAKKQNKKKYVKPKNQWIDKSTYCELCHGVFNVIADFIDHHHIIFQRFLQSLCGMVGHSMGNICRKYSMTYGPIGMSIISSYLHNQMCSAMHLCPRAPHATYNVFAQTNEPYNMENLDCDSCNDVMTLIRTALGEQEAVEDFKTFVETECLKYEVDEAECISLFHSQADALHGLLLKDLTNNDRCTQNCVSRKLE